MQCKNCQKEFTITDADRQFYNKINVLEPGLCPDCRCQERLVWRNERSLYKRKCDLCQKDIVSFYSDDKPYKQYCPECWWSDKWQAPELNYDPARPFLEQWAELLKQTPHLALIISHGENSDYCPHSVYYKNCYMCVSGVEGEDIYYSYWTNKSRDCLDCSLGFEMEQCYECLYGRNLFSCLYCYDCENSSDLAFCADCVSCHNCVGCVGLRHQEFQVFNKKVSEGEYQEALAQAKKDPETFKRKFNEFSLKFPRVFAKNKHCEKVSGDYLNNCKNSFACFDAEELEDCAYLWNIPRGGAQVYDANYAPNNEVVYNCVSVINAQYCSNSVTCWDSSFVDYSWQSFYSSNLFGCCGLKHGKYQILNKKYSEEEYQKVKKEIVENLKQEKVYGDFFPVKYSPFAYNETSAQEHFPLTQEEVLKRGWSWQENFGGTFGKGSTRSAPLTLEDKDEEILGNICTCSFCNKNFKLIKQELAFYRKYSLPLPGKCHDCRYIQRMKNRNPHHLWHRKCMNVGCANEFETSYAPDRPEKVYCEECYQKEIY